MAVSQRRGMPGGRWKRVMSFELVAVDEWEKGMGILLKPMFCQR